MVAAYLGNPLGSVQRGPTSAGGIKLIHRHTFNRSRFGLQQILIGVIKGDSLRGGPRTYALLRDLNAPQRASPLRFATGANMVGLRIIYLRRSLGY